jgi:tetratricopeptide (TPR) repeat protein
LKALELEQGNAIAHNTLGIIAVKSGQLDEATANFNKAIDANPKNKAPYLNRGRVRLKKGDLNGALLDFDKAIEIDPRDPTAYFGRGLAKSVLKDFEGAITQYEKALEIKPDFQQARVNIDKARLFLKSEQSRSPLQARGSEFAASNQLQLALSKPVSTPSVFGAPADLLLSTATLAYSAGEYDRAIDLIDSALQKLTSDRAAAALLKRGHAYLMKGDWDKALHDYDEVLILDPNQANAYIGRAIAYNREKESAKAASELDALSAREFKKPEAALNVLAWFRATFPDATLRDGEQAVGAATKACDLSQWKRWNYVDTLAAAYAERSDFDQAVKYAEQALAMTQPSDPVRDRIQKRIALYKEHKAYREEPFK